MQEARPLRADARQNRDRILAAARDVFVELGPGAPLEEIARRAGTGIATLYRRFPYRHALMRAVVLDALERTAEEARLATEEEPDAFRGLARYMHRALDIRVAAVIPALLDEISMDDEEIRAVSDPGVKLIQGLIDAAKRDGALRPDVTFGDIGTLVVRLSRPLPGSFPREVNDRLGHRHLDLLINGLRATQGAEADIGGPAMTFDDLQEMRRSPSPD
ncbi:MAG TPA: TetR/AcrR family transcriptional regulator [Actinophytocola sp.]|uniref:TetR/AcrR family transcriptional regulator n=1 Tax=Actinophytocola sp. TaxID=1872138 RepID=UPI002DDD1AEE|nr:TetR/AcrR family transcriptional regulator [Actinophytocola sp.]HEV2784096.1 TetR/AcrR family transcriptional regulator [Actinophytocola sp.]